MNESACSTPCATQDLIDAHREAFARIAAAVSQAHTIAICGHTNPDGDALGSNLGLGEVIKTKWPEKRVINLLADSVSPGRIYTFLPGISSMVHAADYAETPDLFIAVDLSYAHRLNNAAAVLERAHHAAILDHHPCDTPFCDTYVIEPRAAAAGVVIYAFAQYLGVHIPATCAQLLFCALMTDSGRFQYQNANPQAFRVASDLVHLGASPTEVSLNIYQNATLSYLHLKALVMSRIATFEHGKIAYSYATVSDFDRCGATLEESEGLVDAVRSVSGAEIILFLKEIADGTVRGNLRSKTNRNVARVAAVFGGGGHAAAAGFTVTGSVDEAFAQVLPHLRRALTVSDE